jgi:hypothetical protein
MSWRVTALTRLNVLISSGFTGAYEQLLPGFEQASGIKVTTGSGASQGTGPHTIAAQLARGVPADVVILSREGRHELLVAKRIERERISTWRAHRSAWQCGREETRRGNRRCLQTGPAQGQNRRGPG